MYMKAKLSLLLAGAMAFTIQSAVAGGKSDKEHKSHASYSSQEESMSGKTSGVRLSKLMDAELKSQDGENLGSIEELMVDPQTGKIDFAVVGRGGFLGIGEKHVPIPWDSIEAKSAQEFTVNVDSERLKSAPTIDGSYANLQDSQYRDRVEQFFSSGSESAVGGSESTGEQVTTNSSSYLEEESSKHHEQ